MSDVVNTSTDTLTRGQNHPGGVQVAACGESTADAPEGSHRQLEGRLSPVPIGEQRSLRLSAGAQTVTLHPVEHMFYSTRWRCIFLACLRPVRTGTVFPAALTTSRDARITGAPLRARSNGDSNMSSGRSALRRTRRSSSSKRCPTTYTCSSHVTRSTASTASSKQSRAAGPGRFVKSSPRCDPGSRGCGPHSHIVATIGGATLEAVNGMLRTSPTRRARPYLPTAKAGGFTGAFR